MEVKVFEGKLGREHDIFSFMLEHNNCCLPRKKEKICLNGDVYVVLDVLQDYDNDEYNIFVEHFDWED